MGNTKTFLVLTGFFDFRAAMAGCLAGGWRSHESDGAVDQERHG